MRRDETGHPAIPDVMAILYCDHNMQRSTIPIMLVLVALAGLLAIALPELFGLITSVQTQTTGVSTQMSELVGRIPTVLFVFVGIIFTAILVMAARK